MHQLRFTSGVRELGRCPPTASNGISDIRRW
jgi:hypothetical protein